MGSIFALLVAQAPLPADLSTLTPDQIKQMGLFGATAALVNLLVWLLKLDVLGAFWKRLLPWWAKLVFFVLAALASALIGSLAVGTPVFTAVILAIGAVGTAVMGREFKEVVRLAMEEKKEEEAEAEAAKAAEKAK